MEPVIFRFPTTIRFGAGSRSALLDFSENFNVRRPLLVTDVGLPETDAYRLMAKQLDEIWSGQWQSFAGIHPNPTEQDIEDAWEGYRGHQCDGIVGVGGGSGIDGAKALRLKVAFPELPLSEIPLDKLPEQLVPFCAVPTTAGTGSEVGRSTVVTLESLGQKVVFRAPPLMPELAILDPELTVGLPPHLTAATGMDAMTHAIEAFVCPIYHPMCDGIALEAIRMVQEYLPRAVADGSDLEARGQMLMAASMGAVAFQKDLGAAHSLAHPMSTEFGIHHGLANAIVLSAVIRFNGETDAKLYSRVANALRLPESSDATAPVAEAIDVLNQQIGITQKLRDIGIPRESLSLLADKAFEDRCHLTNPRKCSRDDLLRLYEEVW